MRVSVIKEKKIQNIILNNEFEGNYWVTETDANGIERNLISIESDDGKWRIVSNRNVYYVENGIAKPFVYLEENKFYLIKNEVDNNMFYIYCSKVITNYNYYEIGSKLDEGVIIGSGESAVINYPFIEKENCIIKKVNDKVFVINNNSKEGIYVNNARIGKYREIKNGDVIFILGLKIIFCVIQNVHKTLLAYLGVNNLDNISINVSLISTAISPPINTAYEDSKDENEYPLYDENEYFYKIPRFVKQIKNVDVQIDSPPTKNSDKEGPALLTIGPMLTMSMTSLITVYTSMSGVLNGRSSWETAAPSLVMSGTMMLSSLLWPTITRKYQKSQKKKNEKERQKKYSAYIDEKRQEINDIRNEQMQILIDNCPPLEEVIKLIALKDISLWQRRIKDPDYLKINLGRGTYPMEVNIHYPEKHFTMDEDNLRQEVEKLGSEPKLLEDVPFEFSFVENYLSGLIGEEQNNGEYMRRLLIQILAFHSYDDLKIAIFTDEEQEYQWKFLKMAPHLFSDDKSVRFFANNIEDSKELSYYLDRILSYNMEAFGQNNSDIMEELDQTYLIITDCFKKVRDLDFFKNLIDNDSYYGFSLFILDNKMIHLPDQCSSYIQLDNTKGQYYNNENFEGIVEFNADLEKEISYEDCIFKFANMPIEIENEVEGHIPEKLGFLEMYKVGKIEHLNIMNRWKLNDPTKSLRAPLGLDKQENIIYLDLHEKYHGPHGLIAGTTGSGKSEFIITYILSMVVNYSPNEVAFILIDYKGGGLAGAFENKKNNFRLPHLAGTITNLDKNEMNRTLVSIQSELTRRQAKFNEARDYLGESTIDIYKYQKFFREGKLNEPMPHLFIVCDEFAELKQQQPDFMDNLISAARIGRSLGVHLILATQKPSGVVNDQIWSNTKFRVCLKVASPGDSSEIIKCPDAASIKQAGRFYLQVGQNEIFVLGQSGYCGGNYVPSEIVKKEIDKSIQFIDNIGNVIKTIDDEVQVQKTEDLGDELSNILKYITKVADKLNVRAENLWLDAIPGDIYLEDIVKKYEFSSEQVTAIIGEYDDPSNQKQGILTIPLDQDSNTMIYGLAGANKEMFLRTLIYSVCHNYTSEQINFYILDFGSESFRIFSKLPQVGDVVFQSEPDKVDKLFKMINDELIDRKKKFADYNGEYESYCKLSGSKLPRICVIINNVETYKEMFSGYDEMLMFLSREGGRYGINFIMTAGGIAGLGSRLLKNYPNIFALDMNNKDQYFDVLGKIGNVYPADYPGRGLFKKEQAYEYQTARICEDDKIIEFIKAEGEKLSATNEKAKVIPVVPEEVIYELIEEDNSGLDSFPIGISKESISTYNYNFLKDKAVIISSNEIENCFEFVGNTMKIMHRFGNCVSVILDMESLFTENKALANSYCNSDFNKFGEEIIKYYEEKLIGTTYNLVIYIIGVEKFNASVDSKIINKIIDTIKNNTNITCVMVDNAFKFKKINFESWYSSFVQNVNGIWIGAGLQDQSVIKLSNYDKKYATKITNEYAWIVKNGVASLIKLVKKISKG